MALYAFEGTWNFRDRKEALEQVQSAQYGADRSAARDTVETNVSRFKEFYHRGQTEYIEGVGTRFSWLGRALGGAFGMGGRRRIRQMYRQLTRRYFDGDHEINLVGFSRGAALAVHFANVITTHGLRNPDNPRHLAWRHFPGLGWTFRHPRAQPEDVKAPTVDFLGLFDTVATFGVPIWPFRNRGESWKVWTIPRNVKRTYHAMALDEVRATFALVRPRLDDAEPQSTPSEDSIEARRQRMKPKLYEVWFRGVHGNVGGGYLDRGLSDIALAWMMEMAIHQWRRMRRTVPPRFEEALAMIEPGGTRPSWVKTNLETLEPDPDGALGRPADLKRQPPRELPLDLKVHHSAFLRRDNLASDHRSSNRPLLRRIPRNARKMRDPPIFYPFTRRQVIGEMATEAFHRIPVRPRPWLKLGEAYIFRSDNWIALGTKEGRGGKPIQQTSRNAFERIAAAWLIGGRPEEAAAVELDEPIRDQRGVLIEDRRAVAEWIVPVLLSLEPYLPVGWKAEL